MFAELRTIMLKTAGLRDVLRHALTAANIPITYAFVYGSLAKGDATAESDVDLLIVSDADNLKLHAELMKVEEKLGRPINYTVMRETEFRERRKESGGFIERITEGSIIEVMGAMDDV